MPDTIFDMSSGNGHNFGEITDAQRLQLTTDLAAANSYDARIAVIRAFVHTHRAHLGDYDFGNGAGNIDAVQEQQLRLVTLRLLSTNQTGTHSYTGVRNYLRLFAGDTAHNGMLATELTQLRAFMQMPGHSANWGGEYTADMAAIFASVGALDGSAARTLLNTAGYTSTAFPIRTVPTNSLLAFDATYRATVSTTPGPTPVTLPARLTSGQQTTRTETIELARMADIPLAAMNNPRHAYWTTPVDEGGPNDEQLAVFAGLFPHIESGQPDASLTSNTYVDPAFTAYSPTTPISVTPSITVAPTVGTLPITGVTPVSALPLPADDALAVTSIGSIDMPPLPAGQRYTGTQAQINAAMFQDMRDALGILANVAGRHNTGTESALNPHRAHAGITQQDLRDINAVLRLYDPNLPPTHESNAAVATQLRALGFNSNEVAQLLRNPRLLQMMGRVSAFIGENDQQFGAVAALHADGNATTLMPNDFRILRSEVVMVSNGATTAGSSTVTTVTPGATLPVDPMNASIVRHEGGFLRARVLANTLIFHPGNRDAVMGEVVSATFQDWSNFRTPASGVTQLLLTLMDTSRGGNRLQQFGTREAIALQALFGETELTGDRLEQVKSILKLTDADLDAIRLMRSNANNRAAAFATSTWMIDSLRRKELPRLHVPTTPGDPPDDATLDDIVVLHAVLSNPVGSVPTLPAGANSALATSAVSSLYTYATSNNLVRVTNVASVPYITQPAVVSVTPGVLSASPGGYVAGGFYNDAGSYGLGSFPTLGLGGLSSVGGDTGYGGYATLSAGNYSNYQFGGSDYNSGMALMGYNSGGYGGDTGGYGGYSGYSGYNAGYNGGLTGAYSY